MVYTTDRSPVQQWKDTAFSLRQGNLKCQCQWFALLYYGHGLTTDITERQLQSPKAGVVNGVVCLFLF